ncbi:hypothetical protein GCM10027600_43040 [Nocardioides ginsengisegetis]
MPRGGARSHSGPAPDPNSARSEKRDWTKLPAEGRQKPAPVWPLVEPSERELELWESWWAEPVAQIWEDAHTLHYVAFTVRMFAEAEQPKARTEDRKSLNQMMANLYLTPDSQLRAGIKIVSAPDIKAVPEVVAQVTNIKDRLNRGSA